jgi:tetratricopeptide (TPR) repeat protein
MKKSTVTKIASSVILATVLLAGCTGKEEREAKYLQSAQQYFDEENIDKAKIEIKNVLQINPNNAKARYLLAQMDEKEQNWKGMFSNLTVSIEADPKLIEPRYKLGLLYIASGDVPNAEKQADAIQKAMPDTVEYFALKAIIAQRQQKPEEADAMAKKALAIDPANVAAVGILAAQSTGKDPQMALDIVTEALKKNNKETTLKLMKLRLLEQQGKTEEVVALFNDMIKEKPDDIGTYYQLTQYLFGKKRLDEAEQTLNAAIAANPENVQPKLWLAAFVDQNRDPVKAKSMLENMYAENLDSSELRNTLASKYMTDKESDKAKALFVKVIDADPKGSAAIDARNKLALIANQENDRKTMDLMLKEVLEIDPSNPDTLLLRAALLRADGDIDGAIIDLRLARKTRPESLPIVLALASAQEVAGIRELAFENYSAALALQPGNAEAQIGIGRILYFRGDFDKALSTLQPVNKTNPTNTEVINIMMSIYGNQQKWDAAMQLLNPLILNTETAPMGFLLKARALAAQKNYSGAQEALEQSLAKKPSFDALRDLVSMFLSQNKADQATALLDKFSKENPNAIYVQELIAGVHMATGEPEKAQVIFAKLIAKNPKSPGLYRKQIQAFTLQGRPQKEVLALLDDGIAKMPKNEDLLMLKAEYLQGINKPLDALSLYEDLLANNPKSQMLQNNIVALILDFAPTKENLEKAQKLTVDLASSENPALLDTVGWLQFKLGNYPQALSLLQDARKKGSKGAVYDYHLGMAYYKSGNTQQAKELLQAATANEKENFPGKDEAMKALQELSTK